MEEIKENIELVSMSTLLKITLPAVIGFIITILTVPPGLLETQPTIVKFGFATSFFLTFASVFLLGKLYQNIQTEIKHGRNTKK